MKRYRAEEIDKMIVFPKETQMSVIYIGSVGIGVDRRRNENVPEAGEDLITIGADELGLVVQGSTGVYGGGQRENLAPVRDPVFLRLQARLVAQRLRDQGLCLSVGLENLEEPEPQIEQEE